MVMTWIARGERALVMELVSGGADWIEATANGKGPLPMSTWGVEARLCGSHYKLCDVFPSQQVAQGSALLLAMRLLPVHRRTALHAALDEVPGAWWWRITRDHDAGEEHSIISSRLAESVEAAERAGRAAGGGWWLTVFGPGGLVRECGLVPGRPDMSK
jgi:hypothetical protein